MYLLLIATYTASLCSDVSILCSCQPARAPKARRTAFEVSFILDHTLCRWLCLYLTTCLILYLFTQQQTLGKCPDPESCGKSDTKLFMCHRQGDGKYKSICVSETAASARLRKGDTCGRWQHATMIMFVRSTKKISMAAVFILPLVTRDVYAHLPPSAESCAS